ncbi:GntR family transcriptional regulator [Pullulanibacillus camelliae]|uniref:GntR family transcriptional regulator n=1 Tax=Pullulanibacillus camelliae TaxID=1707096 RepID=A0A8J2VE13_9BACL|nr:FadR/GntR family transcriptional regulator [Pullulanibacillus camelliae]GGE27103.1 GntR family transcriptional regulator [Pullulanibacillus camelliae]
MKALKKQRLSERVAEEIKNYIKQEDLKKGDRLPPADTLITMLGIGRSSLREALQLLETQGFIEVLNGKGIFVKEVKPFSIQTTLDIENEKEFLLEALDVRMAIEGKAVDLAVEKATQEDIDEMDFHLQEYRKYIQSGERRKANKADAQFHHALYKAAKNALLLSIIDSVSDTFNEFFNEPFGVHDIFDESFPYHQVLLNAIKDKDLPSAREAFNNLMGSVKTAILNV